MAKRSPKEIELLRRSIRSALGVDKPTRGSARGKTRREDDDEGDHEYRGAGGRREPVLRKPERQVAPKGYADSVTARK